MSARDAEAALLDRCVTVAGDPSAQPVDAREANVFRVAALITQDNFRAEASLLMAASQQWFEHHPDVAGGWPFICKPACA
jgi:hypothetical protein